MKVSLTGTPGTGKTSISKILREKGFKVLDLNKIAVDSGFVIKKDKKRNSKIIDIEKLNKFIEENYSEKDLVIIEGHLSHLLKTTDKVIILRCRPDKIKEYLSRRNWTKEKIKENVEAEILDIILCESLDLHPKNNVFEIDVSNLSIQDAADIIINLIKEGFKNIKKYKIGKIDWSEEILRDF
jgi:adenylate kinase